MFLLNVSISFKLSRIYSHIPVAVADVIYDTIPNLVKAEGSGPFSFIDELS